MAFRNNDDSVIRYNISNFYEITDHICHNKEYNRIQNLMKNIYDSHECFSDNYRYTPMKLIQPPRKQLFEKDCITKTEKFTMQILNKITLSNFSKLCNILKNNTDDSNISNNVSIILKYSKYSDIFVKELSNMLESLYIDSTYDMKTQLIIELHEFIGNFLEKLNKGTVVSVLEVETYDDFCDITIEKKHNKHHMTMIIHLIQSSVLYSKISYKMEQIIQIILDKIINDLSDENNYDMNAIGMYIEYMYIIAKTVTSTHILKHLKNDLDFVFDKSVQKILPKKIFFRILDINEMLVRTT